MNGKFGSAISGWWNIAFIFPYVGNNDPNGLSYFSIWLKPPTKYNWVNQLVNDKCFFAIWRGIFSDHVDIIPVCVVEIQPSKIGPISSAKNHMASGWCKYPWWAKTLKNRGNFYDFYRCWNFRIIKRNQEFVPTGRCNHHPKIFLCSESQDWPMDTNSVGLSQTLEWQWLDWSKDIWWGRVSWCSVEVIPHQFRHLDYLDIFGLTYCT